MNNIFLKNLDALNKKNSKLAEVLQSYIPTDIPQLVQNNGAYNILYKGKLVHNEQNPLAEANEIFLRAENTPVSIHVVYGLGLGYLFQFTSLNSKGAVVLYEPDLNILWLAFTLVDFSNDILKSNVFICTNLEEVSEAIYKKSNTKNTPVLLSLPSQREYDLAGFENLVRKLNEIVGAYALDLKYTQQKFYPSLKMLIMNLSSLLNEIPLAHFKDVYKGKTAVVVSAGPTLDRNIEFLKKYRERFVLFTVGTAVKTLYANNIKPDFLCIIETYNSARQVEGLDLEDVNFVTEPYANPTLRRFKFKNIFSHISSNNPINQFWANICDENDEEYLSKGTVSYTALNCARLLGCSKIILVGQDLAYIEGQCYSKDSAYKDLSCEYNKETQKWEITAKDFEKFSLAISASQDPEVRSKVAQARLNNLNKSLYYVKGINGDMIPTESVYATFIKPLEEYVERFNDCKYINTSLVGAQIDGFENLSFEEAILDSEPVGNIDLDINIKPNKELILNNLKSKLEELKKALPILEEGKRISKNINNDLARYRNVNSDILKTLKKLSLNYISLSEDFSKKSEMFKFIITAEKIDLDYEMKMLQDFNIENVTRMNEKMSLFYKNALIRIGDIERLINESINTAS